MSSCVDRTAPRCWSWARQTLSGIPWWALAVLVGGSVSACRDEPAGSTATATVPAASTTAPLPAPAPPAAAPLPSLAFFPELKTPPTNPLTSDKVALGKLLFFDERLGSNKACSDCHAPDRGWADGVKLSTRASGVLNTRHTPSLFNVGYQKSWGWDGRSPTLEAHIDEEWAGQLSIAPADAARRLASDPGYASAFAAAYGDPAVTQRRITQALASFVRSIRSGNAPYDRFEAGDASAVDDGVKRGWELFRNKAGCTACHVPPLYTDFSFHNLGVDRGRGGAADPGRGPVSQRARDEGAFKTPTLRSAASTAPYFHDGSVATLEGAVDFVLGGGHPNPKLDGSITKLDFDAAQRADLVAFIRSLDPAVK